MILHFSFLSLSLFFYNTQKNALTIRFCVLSQWEWLTNFWRELFPSFLIFPNTTLTAYNTENYLYWKLINFLTFFHNHFLLRSLFNWIAITGNSDKSSHSKHIFWHIFWHINFIFVYFWLSVSVVNKKKDQHLSD